MTLLYELSLSARWKDLFFSKEGKGHLTARDEESLITYITEEKYTPIVAKILVGEGLSIPNKKI